MFVPSYQQPMGKTMQASEKTTYLDLSSTSTTGVNALLSGVSADEKAALFHSHSTTDLHIAHQSTPAIGQYWPGQGGYYAGIMRDGDKQWHLVLVDTPAIESAWGTYGETIPGEFSRRDGQHNTALILAADTDNKIASHFTALLIEGHKDCYWPSQCETNLLFANLPYHVTAEWLWSSTPASDRTAVIQNFGYGRQAVLSKDLTYSAQAVRRLPI